MRRLPATLGTRLTVTIVLLALITSLVTIVLSGWAIGSQVDVWARDKAAANTAGARAYLELEGRNLKADVEEFEDDPVFRGLVETGDRARLGSDYELDLTAQTEALALVVLDARGGVLLSHGPAADVSRLQQVAAKTPTAEVSGMVPSSAGPSLVFGSPVRGLKDNAPAGYLIAERPLGKQHAEEYSTVAGDATLSLHEPGYSPPGATLRAGQVAGLGFRYATLSTTLLSVSDLPAVGGGSAGVLVVSDSDTRTQKANAAAVAASLVAGVVAVIIGIALGLRLTHTMRTPIERMVDHVKTQGYLAAEGAPYAGEGFTDDAALPLELRELGAVVEDLLRHLAARQAELKTAIRKAEYAEETLGIVVSESVEAKIVLQDGRVVIANPAASVALGQPHAAMIEHTASEIFSSVVTKNEDGVVMDVVRLFENALEGPITVSLSREDQPERWYIVQAMRHVDDLHNRILVTARDITEERRLQSIRGEIVSLISHDLRSPLSVVIGYLDLLRRPLAEEDREKAIESAKRSAARMADLLEDLLSATRAEELLAPSELVPIPLADLAEDVVGSIAPTHAERDLQFEAHCAPVVLGEEKRLRQVLVNLITNAFKYAPDTSPISVRVSCRTDRTVLEVVDHGPGVPQEDRERIFDRFERLESGGSRPGIGLGLYIVRIITENHGGSVRVEDTPGGGATFVVELPTAGAVVDGQIVAGADPIDPPRHI